MSDLPRRILELERRLRALEFGPQLGYSSIEDGSIPTYDADGNLISIIGKQPDGSHTVSVVRAPLPLQPTDPQCTTEGPTIYVTWDGNLIGPNGAVDAELPLYATDQACEIHIGDSESYVPEFTTYAGELPRKGGTLAVQALAGVKWVRLQMRAQDGRKGPPSPAVPVTVTGLVDPDEIAQLLVDLADAEARVDEARQRLDELDETTLPQLDVKLDQAKGRLDAAFGVDNVFNVTSALEASASATLTTAALDAQSKANAAKTAAEQAAAAHAELVASGAETAAIEAAQTYADTKKAEAITAAQAAATAAETAAKAHADTKASAAETAAISAAQTYANQKKAEALTEAAATAQAKAEAAKAAAEAAAAEYADLAASGASGDALAAAKTYADTKKAEAITAAESAATAAKNAAISAAATDATNKAAAAETAAKNAAALDATAKANAAKTAAETAAATYADLVAAGAEQAAIDAAAADATSKANAAKTAAETAAAAYADAKKTEAINAAAATAQIKADAAKAAAEAAAAADATSKASAAQSAAISAAATDATTKANNAKSQAISAAATDATNKANTAKSDAQEFATTLVSELEIGGRNLLLRSTETEDRWISATGSITLNTSNSVSDFIKITPGQQYAFTKVFNGTPPADNYFRIAWYDSEQVYIGRTAQGSNSFIWTAPAGAEYLRTSYPKEAFPKIEKGNKPTDWTPAPEDVQESIDAAMLSADGKNAITYTDVAAPGPGAAPTTAFGSGRRQFDVHRNRNATTGEVYAEWLWTGAAWVPVNFGDAMLRSLDVGKITGGSAAFNDFVADNIVGRVATLIELNASRITAGTIAAARLDVSALAASMATIIQLDASRITAGTINVARLNVTELAPLLSITANQITGGTISAVVTVSGTIQTAASGARVVINGSGLTHYDANGVIDLQATSSGLQMRGRLDALLANGQGVSVLPEPAAGEYSGGIVEFTPGTTWNLKPAIRQMLPGTGYSFGLVMMSGRPLSTADQANIYLRSAKTEASMSRIDLTGGWILVGGSATQQITIGYDGASDYLTELGHKTVKINNTASTSASLEVDRSIVLLGRANGTGTVTVRNALAVTGSTDITGLLTIGSGGLSIDGARADGAWTAYTPSWLGTSTNPGTHTRVGRYKIIGKTCFFSIQVTLGTNGIGSGNYMFTLPVNAVTTRDQTVNCIITVAGSGDIGGFGKIEGAVPDRVNRIWLVNQTRAANWFSSFSNNFPASSLPAGSTIIIDGHYEIA